MNELLSLFKALSDRNRLRILAALLQHEELCACQIIEMLGVTGATASRHLAQLQGAGLLDSRKEGRWHYYSIRSSWPATFPGDWLQDKLKASLDLESDREKLDTILQYTKEDICKRQRGE